LIEPGTIPFELLSILLYAETHYRFRHFFSYLKKDEPEVIADAPFRVDPGQAIPVLLLVKDADKYPCKLRRVSIHVTSDPSTAPGHKTVKHEALSRQIRIRDRVWWKIFEIPAGNGLNGWVKIDTEFELEGPKGIRTYRNDNHRTSSRKPLRVFVARDPLPRFKGVHFGDIHTHSMYTDDQVEFGAPLEASIRLSGALGLSFFGATDHSYDLDDTIDDYLTNDPTFSKWKSLQSEIDKLEKKYRDFAVLRGEEVSCRSSAGHNVHMVLLGNRDFVEGSGDGAERWFKTRCEHSIHEITVSKDSSVLAFAAHPAEDVPFVQRLLLHRGSWLQRDISANSINGVQFANGTSESGFRRGIRQWIHGLLEGRKLIAVAGNDAHGNFNRFRQIGIPFFTIRETNQHIFGGMRTAVFLRKPLSETAIIQAIAAGNCIITDGPVARITSKFDNRPIIQAGSPAAGKNIELTIEALSGPEFGKIEKIIVWKGVIGNRAERVLFETFADDYRFTGKIHYQPDKPAYVRLEVWTSIANAHGGRPHFCLTNPIWLNPEP